MYTIYSLVDPRDYTTHYVGMTDDVYKRFQQHINCSSSNFKKNAWMLEMRKANVMLIMTTLEQVETIEQARKREVHWIHHFIFLHMPLTNRNIPKLKEVAEMRYSHSPNVSGANGTNQASTILQQELCELLVKDPEITVRDAAAIVGKPPSTVGRYLSRLRQA